MARAGQNIDIICPCKRGYYTQPLKSEQ